MIIVFLYFFFQRVCEDILCKEQLESWRNEHEFNVTEGEDPELKIVYCVGSRWGNVSFGSLTSESYLPPSTPSEFDTLRNAETVRVFMFVYKCL